MDNPKEHPDSTPALARLERLEESHLFLERQVEQLAESINDLAARLQAVAKSVAGLEARMEGLAKDPEPPDDEP